MTLIDDRHIRRLRELRQCFVADGEMTAVRAIDACLGMSPALAQCEARCLALCELIARCATHPERCPKGVVGHYRPPTNAACNCGIDTALEMHAEMQRLAAEREGR